MIARILPTSFVPLFVGAAFVACGAARQVQFALAEPGCTQNPTECDDVCKTQHGGGYCDVLTVVHAEQIAAQGVLATVPLQTLGPLHDNLSAMCRAGIARACAADEKIGPVVAKEVADRVAANQASQAAAVQATQAQDAAKTDLAARVTRVLDGARAVLSFLGADETSCLPTWNGTTRLNCGIVGAQRAGDIIAAANQVSKCGPSCATQLDGVEGRLSSLQQDIDDVKARRAAKQAFDDDTAACNADVPGCQQGCSTNPGSNKCVVIAELFATGDSRVAKAGPNAAKGRDMAKAACAAGNKFACGLAEKINGQAANCSSPAVCSTYCNAQFGDACASLAMLYIDGEGVAKNFATAVSFLRRSCDLASGTGCYQLGLAYLQGVGVQKDIAAARTPLTKACDLGTLLACSQYCSMLGLDQAREPRCLYNAPRK